MTAVHNAAASNAEYDALVTATLEAIADTFAWLRARDVLAPGESGCASVALNGTGLLLVADLERGAFAVVDAAAQGGARGKAPAVRGGVLTDTLSERLPIHQALLRGRPDVRVVLDAAPRGLAAWSIAGQALPIRQSVLAAAVRARTVPLVANHADAVAIAADVPSPALLLVGRGVITWGHDLRAAARRLLGLEDAARLGLLAERLGGMKDFVPGSLERVSIEGAHATPVGVA